MSFETQEKVRTQEFFQYLDHLLNEKYIFLTGVFACLDGQGAPRNLNKCGLVGSGFGASTPYSWLMLFTVQYIPDIVYCSVYSWHCLLFSIFLTLFTVQYIPDIIHCSVYSWHYLLFIIFLTLFTVQYIPDIVYCSVYSWHCLLFVYSWHCLLFSIFLTLAVTLTVFPSITVLVVSEYRSPLIYPYLLTWLFF